MGSGPNDDLDVRHGDRTFGRVARHAWVCGVWFGFAACSTSTGAEANPPKYPRGALDQTCKFVGLEAVEGPTDQNADSVSLRAVYRFAEPNVAPAKKPLSLKFQVERSRVDELRRYLDARPEVICSPEGTANYAARVAPFGNIRGEPER